MHTDDRSIQDAKRALRSEMRQRLSALPRERHRQAGAALLERFGTPPPDSTGAGTARLTSLPEQNTESRAAASSPQQLFAFASMPAEINTWALLHSRWEAGLSVALPRVESDGIRFFSVAGTHELTPGTLGIAEPANSCRQAIPAAGDTILVPGLAFTREGARLGRGGGYYDRFLASIAERVSTVGICYDIQLCESLPCDERDVRVNTVVTL